MKCQKVIVDFEFTGLDNTFINDNEIIQAKALNVRTGEVACGNFRSKKSLTAYNRRIHGVQRYSGELFSEESFHDLLAKISVNPKNKMEYFGFGVEQDKKMLGKYGIKLDLVDLRELVQRSRYATKMATEGSDLETVYYMLIGDDPKLSSHNGADELRVLLGIYKKAIRLKKNDLLSIMPWGHCAGMPIDQYVELYRTQADGYRHNNYDLLAKSLTASILAAKHEYEYDDEDDDEYEYDDEEWDD